IKTVLGINDYRMLKEVISRRYKRLISENKSLPDLIIVDGGRLHLLSAYEEIKRLNLEIPIISIAKEEDKIYTPDKREPLKLESNSLALNLIRRIRDEAHRFAIKYHLLLRRKGAFGEENK
ncbi:MAG: excinuclease ABC subunit C, partial [Candidatus Omnitrophica bacterium]|nr:excinuclease ABC subunit C [Candidatus Omnitrophota bacterium]